MICDVCRKDKVIFMIRMKLSDEEESRDVYTSDECMKKIKEEKK
jgi:hypothetical protein